jgi:hypothetical protein
MGAGSVIDLPNATVYLSPPTLARVYAPRSPLFRRPAGCYS